MGTRTRERSELAPIGYKRLRPTDTQPVPHTSWKSWDWVQDYVGPGDGHPFSRSRYESDGGAITRNWPGNSGNSFKDYVCDALVDMEGYYFDFSSVPGSPSDNTAATELLAKTNPSRPVVDLPVYIAELRDIPRMLRQEGKTFLETAASFNLALRFGWEPFYRDVANLGRFHSVLHNREKELKAFYTSGLRRKRQIFSGTKNVQENDKIIQSLGGIHKGDFSWVTQERVWGHVEWYPTTLPPRGDDALRRLADQATRGLSTDSYTLANQAWELMPWSWLIDYSSNIGDFLMSRRNIVPAVHSPVQIMRYKKITGTSPQKNYSDGVRTEWNMTHWNKNRKVVTKTYPEVHLPYLSWGQLSILGSIGVTRRFRGSRAIAANG